jgi:hypothetical protein
MNENETDLGFFILRLEQLQDIFDIHGSLYETDFGDDRGYYDDAELINQALELLKRVKNK